MFIVAKKKNQVKTVKAINWESVKKIGSTYKSWNSMQPVEAYFGSRRAAGGSPARHE